VILKTAFIIRNDNLAIADSDVPDYKNHQKHNLSGKIFRSHWLSDTWCR
jgi:hypothetical protein